MSSWQTKKLGDVLDKIEGGGTPSKEKREYWHGSIPWASVKDLTNFNRLKTQDYITEEGLANSSSKLVQAGTLITPTRMALGFTVQFDVDVAINQDLKALYPNKSVHNSFLKYWFEANRKKIEKLGVGSTVAGIQVSELRAQKINLPEKAEQERIVGVLEVWDEYIEKLEQKIALKEQLKKGLMQQLLTGKRRVHGFNYDWKEYVLGDLIEVLTDYTANGSFASLKDNVKYFSTQEYAALVRTTDLEKKVFSPERFTDKRGYDYLKKTSLYGGELIMSNVGNIGKIYRVPKYNGLMTLAPNTYLVKFKDSSIDRDYIYQLMRTKQFRSKVIKMVGGGEGAGLVAINKANFKSIKAILPPVDEQREIAAILEHADFEIQTLLKMKEIIVAQKKYLLKNLITGAIRTSENLTPKGVSL